MLKKDKDQFLDLISEEPIRRKQAAEYFEVLENGHFEDHAITAKYVEKFAHEMINVYKSENSDKVKKWIVQFLAESNVENDEIALIMSDALSERCSYLPTVLYYVWHSNIDFNSCKEKIKSLYRYPDPEVRWRVALVLEKLNLSYSSDISTIRALMRDNNCTTRIYGILAFRKLGKVRFVDLLSLLWLIFIDNGTARVYAIELLKSSNKSSHSPH